MHVVIMCECGEACGQRTKTVQPHCKRVSHLTHTHHHTKTKSYPASRTKTKEKPKLHPQPARDTESTLILRTAQGTASTTYRLTRRVASFAPKPPRASKLHTTTRSLPEGTEGVATLSAEAVVHSFWHQINNNK